MENLKKAMKDVLENNILNYWIHKVKDEENGGSQIGDGSQTCRHVFLPLTCGTFPACAGLRRNRRTC